MFESIFNSFRETVFLKEDSNLDADLIKLREIRDKVKNRNEMDKVLSGIEGVSYSITDIKKGERIKKAPLPFTTSTLQQEASKNLNFSTQKTMRIAQQLYEGIDIKGHGTIGIISYLRTDSTRVSEEADNMAREFITENYGEKYLATVDIQKKTDNKIGRAHV